MLVTLSFDETLMKPNSRAGKDPEPIYIGDIHGRHHCRGRLRLTLRRNQLKMGGALKIGMRSRFPNKTCLYKIMELCTHY